MPGQSLQSISKDGERVVGLVRKIRRFRDRRKFGHVRPRRDILLKHIDVASDVGLEIGALCNPLVTKAQSHGNVFYVDYATTEQLRAHFENDPNVRLDAIVETDLIWGAQRLPELAAGKLFDYVLASHVIEHTPNMIGWLREIGEVLRDEGVLCLAIPDKRFTFDIKRELTTLGTLIEYFLHDRRRPSTRDVFDQIFLSRQVDVVRAWSGALDADELPPIESAAAAFAGAKANESSSDYRDVHVNIVTPQSFLRILEGVNELGLLDFSVLDFVDTQRNTLEFFVTLSRSARSLAREDAIARQRESIAAAITQISRGRSSRVALGRTPA